MKTYADVLDATENAMLADLLASKNARKPVAFIDGTGCRGTIDIRALSEDPKAGMIAAARDGGKKLQREIVRREIVRRGWLTQEEIDGG